MISDLMTKARAIVVDDQAEFRALVEQGLNRTQGWECAGAFANGADVLAQLDRLRPDLALVDLVMPGMTGVELVRRLKVKFPQTKCILVSSLPDPGAGPEYGFAGANGLLFKPIPLEAVGIAASKVMAGEYYIPPEAKERCEESFEPFVAELLVPSRLSPRSFERWDRKKGGLGYWVALAREAHFRVASLARIYSFSTRQLEREWENNFAEPPGPWLYRVRMILAAHALYREKTPQGLVQELFWSRTSNFYRDFKRFSGLSAARFVRVSNTLPWDDVVKRYIHLSRSDTSRRRGASGPTSKSPGLTEATLSPRQVAILNLAADGRATKEIAHCLGSSANTVKSHLRRIYVKMKARSLSHAVAMHVRSL